MLKGDEEQEDRVKMLTEYKVLLENRIDEYNQYQAHKRDEKKSTDPGK
jgi:hypothetical protein